MGASQMKGQDMRTVSTVIAAVAWVCVSATAVAEDSPKSDATKTMTIEVAGIDGCLDLLDIEDVEECLRQLVTVTASDPSAKAVAKKETKSGTAKTMTIRMAGIDGCLDLVDIKDVEECLRQLVTVTSSDPSARE